MSLKERTSVLWVRTSTRERLLIALGAIVVFFGAGWPLLWLPVTEDLARSDASMARAREARDLARQAADEIAGLRREARTPRTPDPKAAVERVIDAHGLRPLLTSLDVQAPRVRLTFAAVEFAALARFLDVLGREEQLFPVEALVAQRVEPGRVRAEFALARPDKP